MIVLPRPISFDHIDRLLFPRDLTCETWDTVDRPTVPGEVAVHWIASINGAEYFTDGKGNLFVAESVSPLPITLHPATTRQYMLLRKRFKDAGTKGPWDFGFQPEHAPFHEYEIVIEQEGWQSHTSDPLGDLQQAIHRAGSPPPNHDAGLFPSLKAFKERYGG